MPIGTRCAAAATPTAAATPAHGWWSRHGGWYWRGGGCCKWLRIPAELHEMSACGAHRLARHDVVVQLEEVFAIWRRTVEASHARGQSFGPHLKLNRAQNLFDGYVTQRGLWQLQCSLAAI